MKKALIDELELNKSNNELLAALLYIAQDKWQAAHEIAQRKEGNILYDQIHALLHRIEGDEWNANYWYRRVNKPYAAKPIEAEWNELAAEYLEKLT